MAHSPVVTVDCTKLVENNKKVELLTRNLALLKRCPPSDQHLAMSCIVMDETSSISADIENGRLTHAEARLEVMDEVLTRHGL